MPKSFKTVLFIRFFGYLLFFSGLIGLAVIFWPVAQAEVGYRLDSMRGIKRTVRTVITSSDLNPQPSNVTFGKLETFKNSIIPVSTDFGLVVEKINANAKIVENINPSDQKQYLEALKIGVAHAKGTALPGQDENIYLFSHSTDAPWNIIRYNAIFYLLRELNPGDRIIIFYKDRRYDYIVFDKKVVSPSDISYLTADYSEEILTLQTCDPPGTLLYRLIVRAKPAGA